MTDFPSLVPIEHVNGLLILAGLALFVCSLALIDFIYELDQVKERDAEGRVLPKREWE